MKNFETPYIIDLPYKQNSSGFIAFAELGDLVHLSVKRMFWIKDVPNGGKRGVHAHLKENQVLFCLSGKVAVTMELLDKRLIHTNLDSAHQALFLPALAWSEMTFDEDAILLVISDQLFEEENYIRDKAKFVELQATYQNSKY